MHSLAIRPCDLESAVTKLRDGGFLFAVTLPVYKGWLSEGATKRLRRVIARQLTIKEECIAVKSCLIGGQNVHLKGIVPPSRPGEVRRSRRSIKRQLDLCFSEVGKLELEKHPSPHRGRPPQIAPAYAV